MTAQQLPNGRPVLPLAFGASPQWSVGGNPNRHVEVPMLSVLWLLLVGLLTGGLRDRGFSPAGILGSILGAVIVLVAYNQFAARRRA